MLSNPPSTGNVDLDNFLRSVKRHIDDALRPADGWRLSDFSADVSEVISDKRDLIDIVTRYDDINALKDSVDLILADFAEAIADSKALENQYQDHAEVFTHTMEWWNQNRKIIEDAAEVMAATLQASDSADAAEASALRAGSHEEGASQARDEAVTAKNEAQATATQVATQVETAGSHAGDAQASAQSAAQSAANAANSEQGAKDASESASGSASAAEASAGAAKDAAASAEADREVVEQAATSASWEGDRLTVLGATSPPLTGEPGPEGVTPHIGENGTWWVGETDTGVRAQGPEGAPGDGSGDVLWSELDPILDGKASESHTHTISEVTGLEDALASAGTAEHTHTMSEVEGLEAALDGKAPVSHTHAVGEVTGLQSALDGKAAADHQHSWGDVTGKPTTYPPETHAHTASQISDATTTGRSVLTASSQAAARSAIGAGTSNLSLGTTSSTAAAGNHTHTKADITDLETISTLATVDHVVKRTTSGNIQVPFTPNSSTSAASKSYVDSRTPEIRIVSSPDLATTPGVLYVVTGG